MLFVFIGVAGLLLKRYYTGPCQDAVYSYGGNLSVSFAVYFIVMPLPFPFGSRRILTTAVALGVVELFEALDGFGVMTNVYDPIDFVANAVGIALALAVDVGLRLNDGGRR